jgi:hypothetical protein
MEQVSIYARNFLVLQGTFPLKKFEIVAANSLCWKVGSTVNLPVNRTVPEA